MRYNRYISNRKRTKLRGQFRSVRRNRKTFQIPEINPGTENDELNELFSDENNAAEDEEELPKKKKKEEEKNKSKDFLALKPTGWTSLCSTMAYRPQLNLKTG